MVYVECLNFLLHDTCHVVKSLENFILYENEHIPGTEWLLQ